MARSSSNKPKSPPAGILWLHALLILVDGIVQIVRYIAVPGAAAFSIWALAGKVTWANVDLHDLFGTDWTQWLGWLVAGVLAAVLLYERLTNKQLAGLRPKEKNPLYDVLEKWMQP